MTSSIIAWDTVPDAIKNKTIYSSFARKFKEYLIDPTSWKNKAEQNLNNNNRHRQDNNTNNNNNGIQLLRRGGNNYGRLADDWEGRRLVRWNNECA